MGKLKFKKSRRFISLIILCAVVFSCAATSSCGKNLGGNTAMTLTYGKNTTKFSSNIYSYYLSYQKTMTLYMIYSMYKSMGAEVPENPASIDNPEMWTTSELLDYFMALRLIYVSQDDLKTIKNLRDYVKKQTDDTVKRMLAMVAFCKEHKLELSKDELKKVDGMMEEILKNSKYNKSKASLNSTLFRFNINYDILKEIRKYESLSGVMGRYLFDSNTGKRKVTGDMVNQYYQQVCVRIKHILVPYPVKTYDVNGDEVPYTEQELAEMQTKIDDIYGRVTGGEDFDNLFKDYEDTMGAEGYTLSAQTSFMPQEIMLAAYEMKTGEVRKVESAYGVHIIKKYALLPVAQAYDIEETQTRGSAVMWESTITRMIQAAVTNEELKPFIEKIDVNTAETNLFDISTSDVMFDCAEIIY